MAPDDRSLKVLPELDTLYSLGYEVVTLQGSVDDERLFSASGQHEFDVMHIAAHGQPGSAMLTSESLGFSGILQVARLSGAKLVFLNECGSASMAQKLVNGGIACAIGTFDDVEDAIAKQGGMAFYRELARSQEPHTAYAAAFSGDHYGFFSDGDYAELIQRPMITKLENIDRRLEQLDGIEGGLRRLAWVAGGSALMASATFVGLGLHVWVVR